MPSLALKSLTETPQGYWKVDRYFRPETPTDPNDYIWGGTFRDLCDNVAKFRIANELPLGNIECEVQEWICKHTEAPCRPANPARTVDNPVKITGIAIARFLAAMLAWVRDGGSVPQDEAERRALICAGCKYNAFAPEGGCSSCFGLAARVMQIVGNRKTRMNDYLRFCGFCGCSLLVVPFVPLDILNRSHSNADFPDDTGQVDEDVKAIPCWRKPNAQTPS